MNQGLLPFEVVGFDVTVEEGVKLKWQGKDLDSGRLTIKLGKPGSHGVIDYRTGQVSVEFRVQIAFPQITEMLADMGVEDELLKPIDTVIRSKGAVFEKDHSLRLAGRGEIEHHAVLDPQTTRIEIRAPSQ
jgi:hypothetical protein